MSKFKVGDKVRDDILDEVGTVVASEVDKDGCIVVMLPSYGYSICDIGDVSEYVEPEPETVVYKVGDVLRSRGLPPTHRMVVMVENGNLTLGGTNQPLLTFETVQRLWEKVEEEG